MKKVEIVHDELGESAVVASTLPVWEARGWRRKDSVVEDSSPAEASSATPDSYAPQAESDVTASRDSKKNIQQAEARS